MAHIGRCIITEELLCDALALPEGTRILFIREEGSFGRHDFELIIENEALRDCPIGKIPRICPRFKETFAECGHVVDVKLVTWGQLDE